MPRSASHMGRVHLLRLAEQLSEYQDESYSSVIEDPTWALGTVWFMLSTPHASPYV